MTLKKLNKTKQLNTCTLWSYSILKGKLNTHYYRKKVKKTMVHRTRSRASILSDYRFCALLINQVVNSFKNWNCWLHPLDYNHQTWLLIPANILCYIIYLKIFKKCQQREREGGGREETFNFSTAILILRPLITILVPPSMKTYESYLQSKSKFQIIAEQLG